jgi:hypothetical protein
MFITNMTSLLCHSPLASVLPAIDQTTLEPFVTSINMTEKPIGRKESSWQRLGIYGV